MMHLTTLTPLRRWLIACLALISACWMAPALAQSTGNILVVISAKVPAPPTINNRDIADLFLGRTRHLPNGQAVTPLDNPAASPLRARFYKALTGKAITDINAYWARLLFTGQSSPPENATDAEAVLETVRNNPGVVGYVDRSTVPDPESMGLRVILTLSAP